MRLKRVEMVGFKSFMDRTVLDFRDGVTTILGPNGCGKSNVVDAVRWVLGEQSAKQLRGDRMDDVIFKGTQKRKPLSTAEVQLTFDNTSGELDISYTDVAISRRVTRDGGSDYFLNKTPCRLKDLKDLLYDTGAGNNAYSIIEQEMVGQVLNPHENKVRAILEEGSGVVRYKAKRKEALRKLDLTERDLLRVEDIIEEIARQVRSLARQVGKARRHQRLFNEVKWLELIRAHHETHKLRAELKELEDKVQAMRAEGSGEDAELGRYRVRVEEMRPAIEELDHDRKEREHALSRVEADLSRIEGELLVLKEKVESGTRRTAEIVEELERTATRKAEIEGELETARAEQTELSGKTAAVSETTEGLEGGLAEATERQMAARTALSEAQQMSMGFMQEESEQKQELTALETRMQELQGRQEVCDAELQKAESRCSELAVQLVEAEARVESITQRRVEVEEELARHQDAEGQAEKRLESAIERRAEAGDELARAESRHEIAVRIAAEYEGYRTGAAALLKDEATRAKLKGALAEALSVQSGYESAFELLFGEDADALLVDGLPDARELARRLTQDNLGRGSFLVSTGGTFVPSISPGELPGRPALELAIPRGAAREVIEAWLSPVRVVDTASEAVDAAVKFAGKGVSLLAKEGLFIRADGLVRGGAGNRRELALFGREEKVDELAAETAKLKGEQAKRQATVEAAEADRETVRAAAAAALNQLRGLEEEARDASQEAGSRRSAAAREDAHRQDIRSERDDVRSRLAELMTSAESTRQHLGRHGLDQEASQRRVAELSEQVEQLEAAREKASAESAEARLDLTQLQGAARELESRAHRLDAMRIELREREGRLTDERGMLDTNLSDWKTTIESRQSDLVGLFEQREGRRESVRRAREAIDGKRTEMEAAQEEMRAISERQRAKAEALGELENKITRDQLTIQNFEERIKEKYQTTIEQGWAGVVDAELPRELVREDDSFPIQQVDELLADRRERLEKIGAVNFAAMEEYDEKKTRLEFLEKQRDDLLESKEHLMQAIDKINRTARGLFRETFEQVRENFRDIFQTLFEGGSADLTLLKTDDPLESDIQIHGRPKGKNVDTVALLSGGERALTAIALLFAVYLIKPSPFCILDEVDAPLDDINVGRFVRLLERFADRTQFIVITHNKLTMESADHLYGVTMEENGISRLVSVTFDELDAEDPIKALEAAAAERQHQAENAAAKLDTTERIVEPVDTGAVSEPDQADDGNGNGKTGNGHDDEAEVVAVEAGAEARDGLQGEA